MDGGKSRKEDKYRGMRGRADDVYNNLETIRQDLGKKIGKKRTEKESQR